MSMEALDKLVDECKPPFALKDWSALQNAFSKGVLEAESPGMVAYYETLGTLLHNGVYNALANHPDMAEAMDNVHVHVQAQVDDMMKALDNAKAGSI